MSPSKAARKQSQSAAKKKAANKIVHKRGVDYKPEEIEYYKKNLANGIRSPLFSLPVKGKDGKVAKKECQRFKGKDDIKYDRKTDRLYRGVCSNEELVGHGMKRWLLAVDDPDHLEELQLALLKEIACMPRAKPFKGFFKQSLLTTAGKNNCDNFLKSIMMDRFECFPSGFLKKEEFNMEQFRNVADAYHRVYGRIFEDDKCDLKSWMLNAKKAEPDPLLIMKLRRHQYLLDTIYDHMDVFCDETNDRMDQTDDDIEIIQKQIENMDSRIERHAARIQFLTEKTGELTKTIAPLVESAAWAKRKIHYLQGHAEWSETHLKAHQKILHNFGTHIQRQSEDISQLQEQVRQLQLEKGNPDTHKNDSDDAKSNEINRLNELVRQLQSEKNNAGPKGNPDSGRNTESDHESHAGESDARNKNDMESNTKIDGDVTSFDVALTSVITKDQWAEMFPCVANESMVAYVFGTEEDENEKVAPLDAPQLTRKSFLTLQGGVWLDDEIINAFLHLVGNLPSASDSYIFPTHFMNMLLNVGHLDNAVSNKYDYTMVKRWTNGGIDIFARDKLFFPINVTSTHWILGVVFMKEERVQIFNSLRGKHAKYASILIRFLEDEHLEKKRVRLKKKIHYHPFKCNSTATKWQ